MELQQLHQGNEQLFTAFAESRTGGRSENQDSYGYAQTERGFLVTVCDGMGGGPGGKTASTIAVREIIEGVTGASSDEEPTNVLIKAIRRANMAIIEAANEEPALKGMGSTATVLLLAEHAAYAAFVGDSRIYQLRGRKKVFRTFDHSMVFDLVKQHVITEEQARLSAQSNIITRALGIKPDVEVDVHELPYEKGDRFILCSDGIHGTMPEKDLLKMLTQKKPIGVVTDDVATYVDHLGRLSGQGYDNLTLAMIETRTDSILKPAMSKQTKLLLLMLVAICLISVAINFIQHSRYSTMSETMREFKVNRDSLVQYTYRDSVQRTAIKSLQDSIAKMNKKMEEVNKLTEQ
jgi:protein phosphatase